jgi:hypothetical protein
MCKGQKEGSEAYSGSVWARDKSIVTKHFSTFLFSEPGRHYSCGDIFLYILYVYLRSYIFCIQMSQILIIWASRCQILIIWASEDRHRWVCGQQKRLVRSNTSSARMLNVISGDQWPYLLLRETCLFTSVHRCEWVDKYNHSTSGN